LEQRSQLVAGLTVALSPRVRRIVARNAGLMTGPGTNTYLLGTHDIAVLDPGPEDDSHLQAIVHASHGRIRWVIVTHTHRDHSPLARALVAATGAQLIGLPPPRDGRQDDTFHPDHEPRDGERLTLADLSLTAIHTPGHASNCVCYLLESDALLFTGDHILEGVSPVILPPDGDMSAYLDSLDKLSEYAFNRIAPGHGGLMDEAKRAVEALKRHRLMREDKVLRSIQSLSDATLDELVARVYDDVSPERHAWAKLTLQAHLIKLVREGRICEYAGVWRVSAR
jgi:glyoxylase-like metal-dependent hydrolase (beta-lactamase superfamily II)